MGAGGALKAKPPTPTGGICRAPKVGGGPAGALPSGVVAVAPVVPALLATGGPFGLFLFIAVAGWAAASCAGSAWASVCVTRWAKVGGSGLLLWLRAGAVGGGESVRLAFVCTHHLDARWSLSAWGATASSG